MNALRIRRARLSDTAAIAAAMRASIRHLTRAFYSSRQIAAWSSLPPLYHRWAMTAGGEEYLVAESGERIAGFAARRGREVTALFVRPASARRGIGGALLARLERDVRRSGARSVVTRAALSGVRFYRARGFSGSRRVRVPLPGGGALAALLLRKALRPARRRTAL